MWIDLHTHSTASDGTVEPGDLPHLAREAGLGALALTDHDTTAGLAQCAAAAEEAGIEFVPGIEISTERGAARGNLHILGYFIDPGGAKLQQLIEDQHAARLDRAPRIVDRLRKAGIPITLEQIEHQAGGAAIGRPHVAAILVEMGYVGSITEAFERYLGYGAPAHVRKDRCPPASAIDAIHDAGGLASLAHPVQTRCADDDELKQLVRRLVEQGLDAIEVYHAEHSPQQVEQYKALAEQFGLLMTGGSDFHGSRKPIALGQCRVPGELLAALRGALR
jgi:hypothetical protein